MHGDTAAASDKMRNIRTRDRTSDPDSPYCSQFLFPPSVVSIHAVSITAHRARGAASRAYRAGSERAERSAGVSETWRRRSALGARGHTEAERGLGLPLESARSAVGRERIGQQRRDRDRRASARRHRQLTSVSAPTGTAPAPVPGVADGRAQRAHGPRVKMTGGRMATGRNIAKQQ
jgi:hypothetical protein